MQLGRVSYFLVLLASMFIPFTAQANMLKPFSLAQQSTADFNALAEQTRQRLAQGGFEIIGTYEPYAGTRIYAVTNAALKQAAARSDYGGFGAVLRVSVTQITTEQGEQQTQVAYNNPVYLGVAYNMGTRLENIKRQLETAIGFLEDFGGGEGLNEAHLPSYNYTFGLEDFHGFMELASYQTHEEALRKVEQGLANNEYGIGKVYRVDLPGKPQSLFGISLAADVNQQRFLNDEFVMQVIDHQQPRRSPHLPYEILVNDGKIIALHPHYRLAVNFPDLRMFGTHSFGRLMNLPYVYEEFFVRTVGGKWPREPRL